MKHKGKNRVLAALLAAAMMFQMLPLMVFADDGAASSDVKIEGKEGTYTSLKEAVEKPKVATPSCWVKVIIRCMAFQVTVQPRIKT